MAEDIDRPTCRCHGLPMLRDGHMRGKQKWQCSINERERQAKLYADPRYAQKKRAAMRDRWASGGSEEARKVYAERKRRGVCVKCEEPRLTEALCWDCLNLVEARSALRI